MSDTSVGDTSVCHICDNLHTSTPAAHGHKLSTISQAASSGCKTCHLVSDAVEGLLSDHLSADDIQVGWDTMRIRGRRIVVKTCPDARFLFSIDMYSQGNDSPWPKSAGVEVPRHISGDTDSAAAETLLRHWMAECDNHHQCRRAKNKALLPSRLLDVRHPTQISLYCAEEGETGTYACLSHCWGQAPTLRTTLDNLAAFTSSIPEHALSQVYRDAVSVARRLQIPFIWIDSLCIVQDQEEDWLKESATMANVYSNAVLTIAASRTAGASLFSKAPNEYVSKLAQTVGGVDIYTRKTLDHGHGAQTLPLLTRAWVLQERLLSPRVVHFTDQELIWECMEHVTCECSAIRSLWSPGHVPFEKSILHEPLLARLAARDVQQQWWRLVEEYSRLQLTRERDKLPAIAGAARRVSAYRGGMYLAGLWRDGLLLDLLWQRRGTLALEDEPIRDIPSWSWIAPGTRVLYEDCMATEQLAVVTSASCELNQKEDLFGEISGGQVELLTTTAALEEILVAEAESAVVISSGDESLEGCSAPLEIVFDKAGAKVEEGMTCARIALRKGVYRSERDEEIWLVLVPASNSSFRRVGILKVRADVDNERMEDIRNSEMELVRIE